MQNKFEVNVIASGSKGNSTIIVADDTAILIDAGISCKRIIQGLRACGLEPEDLNGILKNSDNLFKSYLLIYTAQVVFY